MTRLAAFLALLLSASIATANDWGAGAHACWMHQTRRLQHGQSPTGIEIICFAPDYATALRMWRASPAHAALLPRCRIIMRCGDAWVGR